VLLIDEGVEGRGWRPCGPIVPPRGPLLNPLRCATDVAHQGREMTIGMREDDALDAAHCSVQSLSDHG